ncbi:hypothetical protein [Treponema saccharophilum]
MMKKNEERIANGFVWNILGLTFNNFNSLFFLVIVKRINGIEVAGVFAYGYAVACFLYVFSLFYNRAFQISNEHISDKAYVFSRLVFCGLSFVLSCFVALFSSQTLFKFLTIVGLCLFRNLEAASDVFQGIAHKNNRLDYAGKSLFVKSFLGLVIFWLVDYLTKRAELAVCALATLNFFGLIFDWLYVKTHFVLNQGSKKDIALILKSATPILIFSALGMLLLNMQKYLIGLFHEDSFGTIFNILVMPATIMSLCSQYLINPFMNIMAKALNECNHRAFFKIVMNLSIALILIGLFVCFAAKIFGIRLMEIVYDMSLVGYAYLILLVIFSSSFYALVQLFSSALTVMGKNFMQPFLYAVSAVAGGALSVLFMKRDVVAGALYGYAISMLVLFVLYMFVFFVQVRRIQGEKSEIKTFHNL